MLQKIRSKITQAERITVLTGAGVSTASGIPDFRSANGLWTADQSREYYISNHYFHLEPEDFWQKYKAIFRVKLLKDYGPNHVHYFLNELEELGKTVQIITQNVDGLHALAGSSQVIEYHGALNTAACPHCGKSFDLQYILAADTPVCDVCTAVLKPDVVLFGDAITEHDAAEKAIASSDLILVLGTSLQVSPFNLLPAYARQLGIPLVLINREPTEMDAFFDLVVHADLSEAVLELKKDA